MQDQVILYSESTEKELLGLILLDNKNFEKSDGEISEDHFYFNINRQIFAAIFNLLEKGYVADTNTVFYSLNGKVEGFSPESLKEYIENLILHAAGSFSTILALTESINFFHLKRKLHDTSRYIQDLVLKSSVTEIEDVTEEIEQRLYDVTNIGNAKHDVSDVAQYASILKEKLDIARKNKHDITGARTNLRDLDNYTGGLQKSDLIIIASRPSMGKTALAVTMARNIARVISEQKNENGKRGGIVLFSLEMSGEQIGARIAALESGFSVKTIHTGRKDEANTRINDSDWMKIVECFNEVSKLPLYIDDTPALNINILKSRARYMKRKYDISAIFIDYLQLIRSARYSSNGNRVLEIAEITQSLKAIAKELEIPVIALSQLSRAVEGRDEKRPQLSDLRESGTIEQDADIVMFLYREEYYLRRNEKKVIDPNNTAQVEERLRWEQKYEPVKNIAEIIIAKNRNGPVGTVVLHYDRERMLFSNHMQVSNNSPQQLQSQGIDADILNVFNKHNDYDNV